MARALFGWFLRPAHLWHSLCITNSWKAVKRKVKATDRFFGGQPSFATIRATQSRTEQRKQSPCPDFRQDKRQAPKSFYFSRKQFPRKVFQKSRPGGVRMSYPPHTSVFLAPRTAWQRRSFYRALRDIFILKNTPVAVAQPVVARPGSIFDIASLYSNRFYRRRSEEGGEVSRSFHFWAQPKEKSCKTIKTKLSSASANCSPKITRQGWSRARRAGWLLVAGAIAANACLDGTNIWSTTEGNLIYNEFERVPPS